MNLSNDSQISRLNFFQSPLGKKFTTGLTGFGLILFVVFHALGNLLLLNDPQAYNQLAHNLESWGFVFYGIELILGLAIVVHLVVGISIRLQAWRSRSLSYQQVESAGSPSKQSLSSRSMAITGLLTLAFLGWHLITFKFGATDRIISNGEAIRDLASLVIETLQNPIYTFSYVGFIVFLGIHLRHGIWSAAQSIGILEGKTSSLFYVISSITAFLITLGFVIVPLSIYFGLVN